MTPMSQVQYWANPESNMADVTDAEAGRGVPTIAHVAQYLADMIVTWDTGMSRKGPLPASLIEQSLTRFFGSAHVPIPDAGKAEGNAVAAVVAGLADALDELVDSLTISAEVPIEDPAFGDEVRALGKRIGFGALMSAASYEWRVWLAENGYPLGGEFVAGPCRSVLQHDLRVARAALAALPPANGEGR